MLTISQMIKVHKLCKIFPANDDKLCIICKDEEKSAKNNNCITCKNDSWFICTDCKDKLEKCPVCRRDLEKNSTNYCNTSCIIIDCSNLDSKCPNLDSKCSNINCKKIFQDCYKFIYTIIKIITKIFIVIYVGKIYIYIWCTSTCDNEHFDNECTCDKHVRRNNYWIDLTSFYYDILVACLTTLILYNCCLHTCRTNSD